MVRILFVGTSDFAVPALRALVAAKAEIPAVVTQPDRPKGRGLRAEPTPVKHAALEAGLRVLQPEDVNAAETVTELSATGARLAVVAAYGQKLSRRVLSLFPGGWFNLHASLLPRHRGASPVVRSLLDGDEWTGVTIFRVVEKMDAGPIVGMARLPIEPPVTAGALTERLAHLAADLLVELRPALESGRLLEIPQDEAKVTYAGKLTKADGQIDWTQPPAAIVRRVYALQPWPGAFTTLLRKTGSPVRVTVTAAAVGPADPAERRCGTPGEIQTVETGALEVAAESGVLRIGRLRPEGKREQSAAEFVNGYRVARGDLFGRHG